MKTVALKVTEAERIELEARTRSRKGRAGDARRARLILLLASGRTYDEIQKLLDCDRRFIARWKKRWCDERLSGLYSRHRGRVSSDEAIKLEAKILRWTQKPPTDGSTHWSTRRLAKALGVDHMVVARTWKKHGIQPHRTRRYMESNDPDFETKATDVIGLYLKPPQNAAVFCVDEKTAIQALDRKDPILPLSPGRAERLGFEYVRHGTLSLYAAFNTANGEVFGKTTDRHTSQEFIAFLQDLLSTQPKGQEIHVVLDNLSSHKTKAVRQFLEDNPNVHFHFTPTYSSWLNQVELWFSKIERDLIHRGVFTSVDDLAKRIVQYIRGYNQNPRPVKWKYSDPTKRITSGGKSSVTVN
jgi:transposase